MRGIAACSDFHHFGEFSSPCRSVDYLQITAVQALPLQIGLLGLTEESFELALFKVL
jgi:hypothetical protein